MTSNAAPQSAARPRNARKGVAALALAGAMFAPGAVVFHATPASAQRAPNQRVAQGTVENKDGAKMSGAVVYLKDTRSLAVKSYVTNEQGYFHFTQLSPDTDYELWVEMNGKRTKSKAISNFDMKKEFNFSFKLDD